MEPREERGGVVDLQPAARLGDGGEARRVRLGKAVERERRDGPDDLLLRLAARGVGRDHGDLQELLLEERDADGALEDEGGATP